MQKSPLRDRDVANGRMLALHAEGLGFNPQHLKKKKKILTDDLMNKMDPAAYLKGLYTTIKQDLSQECKGNLKFKKK